VSAVELFQPWSLDNRNILTYDNLRDELLNMKFVGATEPIYQWTAEEQSVLDLNKLIRYEK